MVLICDRNYMILDTLCVVKEFMVYNSLFRGDANKKQFAMDIYKKYLCIKTSSLHKITKNKQGDKLMDYREIPMGFSMALAQRPEAMQKFSMLSESKQNEIINGTHAIHSKKEMRKYVDDIILKY